MNVEIVSHSTKCGVMLLAMGSPEIMVMNEQCGIGVAIDIKMITRAHQLSKRHAFVFVSRMGTLNNLERWWTRRFHPFDIGWCFLLFHTRYDEVS